MELRTTIETALYKHKADKRLRKSEEGFRSLIDQASDAILVYDFNGKILDLNRHAWTSLGYTREELLTMSASDIDPDMELRRDSSTFSSNLPATFEARHRRKARRFPRAGRLVPIEYEETKVVLGIGRDITDRKEAETKLLSSQERLRYLLSASPCVTYACKPYGDYGATFISGNVKIYAKVRAFGFCQGVVVLG